MANWDILKRAVSDVIKVNGNQEITGQILQNTLLQIINSVGANATFAGVAIPTTNPGVPDGPVFYFASTVGQYSNFNAISVTSADGVVILIYNNNSWQKILTGFAKSDEVNTLFSIIGIGGTSRVLTDVWTDTGCYLMNSTSKTVTSNYVLTDFIELSADEYDIVYGNPTTISGITIFNSSKNVIGWIAGTSSYGDIFETKHINKSDILSSYPSAAYFRASSNVNAGSDYSVTEITYGQNRLDSLENNLSLLRQQLASANNNISSLQSEYSSISEAVKELNEYLFTSGTSRVLTDVWTDTGCYLMNSTSKTVTSNYVLTDFIELSADEYDIVYGNPTTVSGITIFNSSKNVIGWIAGTSLYGDIFETKHINKSDILSSYPSAAYFRASSNINAGSDYSVTEITRGQEKIAVAMELAQNASRTANSASTIADKAKEKSDANSNILNGSGEIIKTAEFDRQGFYLLNSTSFSTNTSYKSTSPIPILNVSHAKLNIGVPYTVAAAVVLSSAGTPIKWIANETSGDTGWSLKEYEIDINAIKQELSNASYIVFTSRASLDAQNEYTDVGDSKGLVQRVKDLENEKSDAFTNFGSSAFNNCGHTAVKFSREYQMFVCYGQSLSDGSDSLHINDEIVPNCFMLGPTPSSVTGMLQPLRASDRQHPIVSTVNSFASLYSKFFNKNKKFIGVSCGVGGRSIAQLSKASRIATYASQYDYPIGGAGRYESNFLTALDTALLSAGANNIECPCIIYLQGERDYYSDTELGPQGDDDMGAYSCANNKDLYKQRMLDLKNDMQQDIMNKFNQTYKPIFCIYQVSGDFVKQKSYGSYLSINMAQLEFAQENDDVILVAPPYYTPEYNSGHLSTNGYRWLGESIAKSLYEYLALNSRPEPIQIASAVKSGNDIILSFSNVVGKLKFDDSTVEYRANFGFELWLNGTYSQSNISNIEIISRNQIKITPALSIGSANIQIAYGGAKVGGSGNVRDTCRFISMYNYTDDINDKGSSNTLTINHRPVDSEGNYIFGKHYPMYNWLTIFKISL